MMSGDRAGVQEHDRAAQSLTTDPQESTPPNGNNEQVPTCNASLISRQHSAALAVLDTILQKMLEARVQLAASQDPEQCEALLGLLKSYTSSFKHIQSELL
jgi:hypothetical protein